MSGKTRAVADVATPPDYALVTNSFNTSGVEAVMVGKSPVSVGFNETSAPGLAPIRSSSAANSCARAERCTRPASWCDLQDVADRVLFCGD